MTMGGSQQVREKEKVPGKNEIQALRGQGIEGICVTVEVT